MKMESSETTRCPSVKRKRINRTDLAYAAGILDGEGCISCSGTAGHPYPNVRVTNTKKHLIVWFQDRFGGSIYEKKKSSTQYGFLPQWDWSPKSADMVWFLKLMIPFLKLKQRQARLAVILRSMIGRKSKLSRKIRIAVMIKSLND